MIIDWIGVDEDLKDHFMLRPEGKPIGEWAWKFWDDRGGRELYFRSDGSRRKRLRKVPESEQTPEESNPVAPEGE